MIQGLRMGGTHSPDKGKYTWYLTVKLYLIDSAIITGTRYACIRKLKTTTVVSRVLSKLLFAICVGCFDRAHYGF